jgi:hypothetical protein
MIKYTLYKHGDLHNAVMDLVTQGQNKWSYGEWAAKLEEIESSDLTIAQYIEQLNSAEERA